MGDFITFLTVTNNNNGPFGEAEIESESIYAEIKSIGMQEFYASKGVNTKVDIKFIIYANEYKGENKVKYDDKIYNVVRTYKTGLDKLEITCVRV